MKTNFKKMILIMGFLSIVAHSFVMTAINAGGMAVAKRVFGIIIGSIGLLIADWLWTWAKK